MTKQLYNQNYKKFRLYQALLGFIRGLDQALGQVQAREVRPKPNIGQVLGRDLGPKLGFTEVYYLLPNQVPSSRSRLRQATQNLVLGPDFRPRPRPNQVQVQIRSRSRQVIQKSKFKYYTFLLYQIQRYLVLVTKYRIE